MIANVGSADKIVRIVLGAALILLPFLTSWALWASPMMKFGAIAVGAILVLTALVSFCPLYRLIGVRTCPVD